MTVTVIVTVTVLASFHVIQKHPRTVMCAGMLGLLTDYNRDTRTHSHQYSQNQDHGHSPGHGVLILATYNIGK